MMQDKNEQIASMPRSQKKLVDANLDSGSSELENKKASKPKAKIYT